VRVTDKRVRTIFVRTNVADPCVSELFCSLSFFQIFFAVAGIDCVNYLERNNAKQQKIQNTKIQSENTVSQNDFYHLLNYLHM
jgi:hypothetical protein